MKIRGLSLLGRYEVTYHRPQWVTRLNANGIPYECVGAPDVPGIPRQWLDAIVYLYPSEEAANSGAPYGGTGFLMTVDPAPGAACRLGHLYAVTNAHVIEGGGAMCCGSIPMPGTPSSCP